MRTYRLLCGVAVLALAGLVVCALSASQTPGLKGEARTLRDVPAKEAEEKTEEFEYVIAGEKKKGTCQVLTLDLGDGVTMEFVRIKAGKFQMGSPDSDKDAKDDEKPRHEVEITKDFYLGKYLVTQEQYKAVMGDSPSYFCASGNGKKAVEGLDTKRFPMENVSWEDAGAFCKKLSEKVHRVVVLPTEAQWEYACRAGTETRFSCGDDLTAKDANFDDKLRRPGQVGSYPANPWGLYDMHGDVLEWCADYYDAKYYGNAAKKDPENATKSNDRVFRGGSWSDNAGECRAAVRERLALRSVYNILGMRVCFRLD